MLKTYLTDTPGMFDIKDFALVIGAEVNNIFYGIFQDSRFFFINKVANWQHYITKIIVCVI